MIQTSSDAFRGLLQDSDVVLEFGRAQRGGGSSGPQIDLDTRIVLPAPIAKRLLVTLNEAVLAQERSARFRHNQNAAGADASNAAARGSVPVNAPPDPAAQSAALLMRLVAEIGAPYQYERSFRVSARGLEANRYLLTLQKRDVPGDACQRVEAICKRLGMPAPLHEAALGECASAICIHFGFEGHTSSTIYKIYLERIVTELEAAQARASGASVLMHVAFKWDVVSKAHVVTKYLWYPHLNLQQIEARMAQVYGSLSASYEIARGILALAVQKAPAERLQYLEVQEDNGRWSFDLNVYDARVQVREVQSQLQAMREHFGLRPSHFQALYDQIKHRTLGHVAGGVHRDGQDFFNVYYGVAGLPQFAQALA